MKLEGGIQTFYRCLIAAFNPEWNFFNDEIQ